MAKNTVYAFLGPMCSGKSTMVSQLMSMGIHYVPSITTKVFEDKFAYKRRLFRTVSKDDYNAEKLVVSSNYQGSTFGLRKDELLDSYRQHRVSVIILMNTDGIKQLTKFINQDLVTIYLMVNDEVFIERLLRAGCSNEEINYYMEYAESNKEFEKWKQANYVVKNTSSPRTALEQILSIMGLMTLVPQADFNKLTK
ncbi:MAG: guanylate kinase [Selenomonadaceae bacterium]|nr:guanylate kinase [Selenomonadaceae bacterium]